MPIEHRANQEATVARADSPRAWLMVAAAFLASFVVFGVIYSFGVFLKPMAAEFDANAVGASAFFSITAAVFYASGAVTGRLADRYEPRRIVAIRECSAAFNGNLEDFEIAWRYGDPSASAVKRTAIWS